MRSVDGRWRTQGERRIRLGQSDRAHACRPLPRGRGRRRARQSAGLRRPPGNQGILHQRCRRADRRARPLGDAALPRGAGRDDRRNSGGALSRRLSGAGRPGAGEGIRRCAAGQAGGRGAAARQGAHHRGDDGDDPRGSRAAQRASRGVLLRALAARRRRQGDPGRDQRPHAEGLHLQGQAAAAQGPEARGLGGSRADAVPVDRRRRRHRPAAGQVGRLATPISRPTSPISRTRSGAASTS